MSFFQVKKKFNPKKVDLPEWSRPFFNPSRYKGLKGGRGSGKSHFFAHLLVMLMVKHPDLKAVSVREHAVSTADSTRQVIIDKIDYLGVRGMFKITDKGIFRIGGKGKIIFRGLKDHNAGAIKSLEGFDICWVEEAQQLSHASLEALEPTIRHSSIFPEAEIWFSWNPYVKTDAVDKFFEPYEDGDKDFMLAHVNYLDNPYCPITLIKSANRMKIRDYDSYLNIWLGHYLTRTDDQVFGGRWEIGERTPDPKTWDGPYHGLDFGFAKDPTAAVKVWVTDKNELYVESECGKVGLDLDYTPDFLISKIPTMADHKVRADSARPESISYLKRHGISMIDGVEKWSGSVKDGVDRIKAFDKIVVHPDCKEVQQEMVHYKYKTDKRSGDILPDIIDKNNHYIDAIRYAICPLIKDDGNFTDWDSIL